MSERERIDEALARHEQESARLFRKDGSRRYPTKEHAERQRRLDEELQATLADVEEALEKKISSARAALLRHVDPGSALCAQELRAADRRSSVFVQEAQGLPLEQLARRLEAALEDEATDAATAYLLGRCARERATRERAAGGKGAYSEGYLRLEAAISRLDERLKPAEIQAAERTIEEARKLKDYAFLRRRGANAPGSAEDAT